MQTVGASVWALGWWLGLGFVLLCWVLGSYRRLQRLRGAVRHSFVAVDEQLQQALTLLHKVQSEDAPPPAQAAFQALWPTAQLLQSSLAQARSNPLHVQALGQLNGVWQAVQAAWRAYTHILQEEGGCTAQQAAWDNLGTLLHHNMQQFNHAVQQYNSAIALAPASLLAKILGLQAARPLELHAPALLLAAAPSAASSLSSPASDSEPFHAP